MRLEYVLSGLSHTKLTTPYYDHDGLKKLAASSISHLTASTNHDIGLLFNAMMEANFPVRLEQYRPVVKSIHSDSGGLQLAQQGKPLTPAIEDKIYRVQCLNSNIAMSIDSIPLEILPQFGDPRTDMNAKRFVISENKKAGIVSGQNLNRQLQAFKKHYPNDTKGYDCKPLVIIQGNSLEDFHTYFDGIMEQIAPDDVKLIGGYALAGSAIGIGTLEAMDTLFSFLCLNKPKEIAKKIHLLGYGSVQRLMPLLAIKETLFRDYEISYDSTTHTSKYNFGSILDENGQDLSYGTEQTAISQDAMGRVFDVFAQHINGALNVDKKTWVDVVTSELTGSTRYHGSDEASVIHRSGPLLCSLYSCYNFINLVDRTEADINSTLKPYTRVLSHIRDSCVNPQDWFSKYRNTVSRYLPSKRIQRVQERGKHINTLEF